MKINLICASKIKKNSPLYGIYNEYAQRITDFKINLVEIDDKNLNKDSITKQLFSHIKDNTFIILLDERGEHLTSTQMKQVFYNFPHQGIHTINILIGGPDGFEESYKNKANMLLSLSKFTLPHQMARLILIEQLYRIQSINHNHPYHKD